MPQEGYDYDPDTCPYNPDNKNLENRKKNIVPLYQKSNRLCQRKNRNKRE